METILVTGGAGYIGIHVVVNLLNVDYDVIVLDDLSNSNISFVEQIWAITQKQIIFYSVDIRGDIDYIFKQHKIDAVIHLAGLKSVPESVNNPIKYYDVNIGGTINLLKHMDNNNCHKIIYSSSACVYEPNNQQQALTEDSRLVPYNPYGWSKLLAEKILLNCSSNFNVTILRYFNPLGVHPSGHIKNNARANTSNLMPNILKALNGDIPHLVIYGDGSAVRDFIHVEDVSFAHIQALTLNGKNIFNIGTGRGTKVIDVIRKIEKWSPIELKVKYDQIRPGDIEYYYANADAAKNELNWKCVYDLDDMCRHSLLWLNKI